MYSNITVCRFTTVIIKHVFKTFLLRATRCLNTMSMLRHLVLSRMALVKNNSSKCPEGLEDSCSALLFAILNRFRHITLTAVRKDF